MSYIDDNIRTFEKNLEEFKKYILNQYVEIGKDIDSNPIYEMSDIYYPVWNTFDSGDIGEAIIKILAAFSHTVDMYRGYFLNNLYLPTNERDALEQIYEMLNYKSGLKRALVLSVNFAWIGCASQSYVIIPKFYKLSLVADGIEYNFLTLSQALYTSSSSRMYVDIILGDLYENTIRFKDIIGNKIFISDKDIDSESLVFDVDGREWTQVRNIYYEKNPSYKYSVHKEANGTYLYLTENWVECIPSEISDISIKAVLIQPPFNTETEEAMQICLVDQLFCSLDEDVTSQFDVTLINSNISSIRGDIGDRRIITLDDYEYEAKAFPGVVCARAFNWGDGQSLGINVPNMVRMVVTDEDGVLGTFAKRGLIDYINSIALEEIDFDIIDPTFRKIDIVMFANIGVYKGTVFQPEIYQNIRDAILEYMKPVNMGIGKVLNINELLSSVARSDDRIRYIDMKRIPDYIPELKEVPTLGNLSIDFNIEIIYKYDTAEFIEVGNMEVYSEDSVVGTEVSIIEARLLVTEEIHWDYVPEEEIYFEKEFYDNGTLIETNHIEKWTDSMLTPSDSVVASDGNVTIDIVDKDSAVVGENKSIT